MPFRFPVVQGCRGQHYPCLPSAVFPVRRCCNIRSTAPSALPGSGCANTWRPATPLRERPCLSFCPRIGVRGRPWPYRRQSLLIQVLHPLLRERRPNDVTRQILHSRIIAGCLLYTSDAADDLLCVDLGGRRIIKK